MFRVHGGAECLKSRKGTYMTLFKANQLARLQDKCKDSQLGVKKRAGENSCSTNHKY